MSFNEKNMLICVVFSLFFIIVFCKVFDANYLNLATLSIEQLAYYFVFSPYSNFYPFLRDNYISDFIIKKNLFAVSTLQHGIFLSYDKGENWETINDNLPGLRISTLCIDKDNYLYASTVQGIYKTNYQVVSVKEKKQTYSFHTAFNAFNYPNPFNSSTIIELNVNTPQVFTITIYDVMGAEVKQITNKFFNSGSYDFYWGGDNEENNQVSAGVYFIKVEGTVVKKTLKTILLK